MLRKLTCSFVAAIAVAAATPSAAQPALTAAAQSPQAVVDELIAADRNFSDQAAGRSVVEAIAAMLAPDAIMPLPSATFAEGKDAIVTALKANPANATTRAQWAPVRGGISADGQHGFTYGFMTLHEAGKPERRAKYLAYWVKRPEGWRVAAYKRAPSSEGAVATALRPPALPSAVTPAAMSTAPESHKQSLAAAEKAFSDRAQQVGLSQAFAEFGSADAMNMGQGPDFTFGNEAIGKAMPAEAKSPLHWAADEGALVAASGDLGVTWGFIRLHDAPPPGRPAEIPFFTVWRRASPQQPWRYIAE